MEELAEDTCGRLADACILTQAEFTGSYECEVDQPMLVELQCYREQQCTEKLEIGDGFVAVRRASKSLNCSYPADGSGVTFCDCSSNVGAWQSQYFALNQISVIDACGVAAEVCWDGTEVNVGVDELCSPYEWGQTVGDNYCTDAFECTRPATIGEREIGVSEVGYVTCGLANDAEATCTCDRDNEHVGFEISATEANAVTCASAMTHCDAALAAAMTSELSCDFTDVLEVDSTSCSAILACQRTGSAGNLLVHRDGSVSAACSLLDAETGEWTCNCAAGNSGDAIVVTPAVGLSGTDVCISAATTCANTLDVSVGYVPDAEGVTSDIGN
jgi:hypothetical protein